MYTVFVYGSLRKHEPNHALLATAEPVAMQCRVRGKLYDTGFGYPAMALDPDAWTYGELYQVNGDQLQQLDWLEGYHGDGEENHYDRVRVFVQTYRGWINAHVYVFSDDKVEGLPQVEFGDWRVFRNIRERKEWWFFAYGSAMDNRRFELAGYAEVFQRVVGCGTLQGYNLTFTKRSCDGGRADLMETGGHAEGKVYRIGPTGLAYLFEREGAGREYRPAFIDVDLNGEQQRDALVFLNLDKQDEVSPPDWYVEEILRGAFGCVSEAYWHELQSKISRIRDSKRVSE